MIAYDAVASTTFIDVWLATKICYFIDEWHKKCAVVVAKFALQDSSNALKSHTCIDAWLW